MGRPRQLFSSSKTKSMSSYYTDKLSAHRLKQCYEIAPPRVKQYLEAEVNHVLEKIRSGDLVLELGCGYGRILPRLARDAGLAVGVDTSLASLRLARETLCGISRCSVLNMNALQLAFRDRVFDRVVCIQNGISAFHVGAKELLQQSIRVTRSGGSILYSSYSDKFWQHRLEWFRIQSEQGLLGKIDWEATDEGVIACKDGFRATTFGRDDFASLLSPLGVCFEIYEVDSSSLFCEITPRCL